MWLALDASGYTGSAALIVDGTVLAACAVTTRDTVAERLMPAVVDLVEREGRGWTAIERVVVGGGPGSFTSLRIAASLAKGIALGRGIPLASCRSLALMTAVLAPGPGRYVAVLDALRGEVYAGTFEVLDDGRVLPLGGDERWPAAEVSAMAGSRDATLLGWPGDLEGLPGLAGGVARLAGSDLVHDVSLASWEPHYGRLAEAQVQWERAQGRALTA